MKYRLQSVVLLLAVTLLVSPAVAPAAPAQAQPKVFEITMTSFKFEPNLIRFNEGDTVVLRLISADQFGRAHDLASAYLLDIPLTIPGDGRESVSEGRKRIFVDAGKRAEVEFVAKGRGSFAFICSLFSHAPHGGNRRGVPYYSGIPLMCGCHGTGQREDRDPSFSGSRGDTR